METFVLRIKRLSGYVGIAATTKVIVDGSQRANLRSGGVQHFTLPRKPVSVVLLNQVPMGKDIEKVFTIDPRNSAEVTLLFNYKFNPKSLLPFGAFTQQQMFIESEIIYGPSVDSPQSATSPTNEQPSLSAVHDDPASAPDTDVKYCTECGTPNPQAAKFCQNCGNKF